MSNKWDNLFLSLFVGYESYDTVWNFANFRIKSQEDVCPNKETGQTFLLFINKLEPDSLYISK